MSDLKTPAEWALELGHIDTRATRGQSIVGQEVFSVPSSAYAGARSLHLWEHDEHHAGADCLRVSREVFDAALEAAKTLVPVVLNGVRVMTYAPVREALGRYTPAELVAESRSLTKDGD
jgi:hypothetical protein